MAEFAGQCFNIPIMFLNIPILSSAGRFLAIDIYESEINSTTTFCTRYLSIPLIKTFDQGWVICVRDHSFNTFAKFAEKRISLTPDTLMYVCTSWNKKVVFWKIYVLNE